MKDTFRKELVVNPVDATVGVERSVLLSNGGWKIGDLLKVFIAPYYHGPVGLEGGTEKDFVAIPLTLDTEFFRNTDWEHIRVAETVKAFPVDADGSPGWGDGAPVGMLQCWVSKHEPDAISFRWDSNAGAQQAGDVTRLLSVVRYRARGAK